MYKVDCLTGVPIYVVDPPYELEITDDVAQEWCDAHHLYGAVANSCFQKILKEVMPGETLAQVSARLGYGNDGDEETLKWYYDRGVLILQEGWDKVNEDLAGD